MFTKDDFKNYRSELGFTSIDKTKKFLGAKDIIPSVNYTYINDLNNRLGDILSKLNTLRNSLDDAKLDIFKNKNIEDVYTTIKTNNLLPKMNNQGRRPESVYFNWMRGYLVCEYFKKDLAIIFGVNEQDVVTSGDDDFSTADTFKRTPAADLEMRKGDLVFRIEVQSGFADVNDVKQHKVLEAQRIKRETGKPTILAHFDIFNGQVAIIRLDTIDDNSPHWITRQQMEGQTVFNISQNDFVWKLTDESPRVNVQELLEDA